MKLSMTGEEKKRPFNRGDHMDRTLLKTMVVLSSPF